jgi:hypothetical protein
LKPNARTYAGLDDDATIAAPILPGSKQLEYRDNDLQYRDIYFGMTYFVGQEVVSAKERAIWSMSYAGGLSPDLSERHEVLAVYSFLRKALLGVSPERPFRGPFQFEEGDYRYANAAEGGISAFHGNEHICLRGRQVYGLRYGGGILY